MTNQVHAGLKRAGGLVVTLAVLSSAGFTAPAYAATGVLYNIQGRDFQESQLRDAYQKIAFLYGMDLDSHQCKPLGHMGGEVLEGKAEKQVGSRLWIQASDGRKMAVQAPRGSLAPAGSPVKFAVTRPKSGFLSIRDKFRRKSSAPQYTDVTMTFTEFVHLLRRGQHFPEAPELGTRPGRKGLFATRRTTRNRIQDILADRSTNSASYSSSAP